MDGEFTKDSAKGRYHLFYLDTVFAQPKALEEIKGR